MTRHDGALSILLAIAVGILALAGCGPAVVPSQFSSYVSSDGSFKCDAPGGWSMTGGGMNGNYNATFTSGSASINVTADVTGSLLADIAKNNNQIGGDDKDDSRSPLAQLHEKQGENIAEELKQFKDVNTTDIKMPIASGKKSEYTGVGGFGSKQHGYRVTSLLTTQRLTVICRCPENEWKALQPVFDRVINSMASGR